MLGCSIPEQWTKIANKNSPNVNFYPYYKNGVINKTMVEQHRVMDILAQAASSIG